MSCRAATRLLARTSVLEMAPKRRSAAAAAPKQAEAAEQPAAKRPRATRKAGAAAKQKTDAADTPAKPAAALAAAEPAQESGVPSFYLMKSEPDVFSIDDLAKKPDQIEHWDGVRSHQAKKVLQGMRVGDQAFFYHSNAKPPGIVGIVEVVREAYPDHTQFDSSSEYFDASSSHDKPKWVMVDVKLVRKLQRQITLEELKRHACASCSPLVDMALFKYGRLSVQPVTARQWEAVLGLETQPGGSE